MSGAALTAARVLWPAFRRMLIRLGRWVARRVQRRGASWVADRMLRRSTGYQTRRLQAARRSGRKLAEKFRYAQIKRWRRMAEWLRENKRKIGKAVAGVLDRLAWEARIPMTLPGEGFVK